jgi:putative transposase
MSSPLRLGDQVFDAVRKKTLTASSSVVINGRIRLLNEDDEVEELLRVSALREGISGGIFRVIRKDGPLLSPSDIANPNLTTALAMAHRVTRVISDRAHTKGVSFNKAYEAEKNEHSRRRAEGELDENDENEIPASTPIPSKATVYRYSERMRHNKPLLRGHENKGNRVPRYADEVVERIAAIASEHYLQNGSRWNVTAITRLSNQELADLRLIRAGATVSKKFVKSVIHQLSPDPSAPRMDPKDRPAAKSVAKAPIRVNGLLQRVEQDALHLPWRFRTPHGETVNVWLVHAICCASSIPVGFHFVIGSPRESDGLKCVQTILFSKAELLAGLGVTTDIDLYGAPGLLVFDNGAEAKGNRMKNLVQIGTDPHYLKSRNPQGKPFIERLNRSLKEALQTLPGSTRFDDVDGQRDPELLGDCSMPLDEFKTWVARWYYEVWVNTPLKRFILSRFVEDEHLGDTAAERFRSLTSRGYSYPLPPNRLAWERTKYEHVTRTLSDKTGVTIDGFEFRGPNLPGLIARLGMSSVTVLVDPDDFRSVFVMDGDENIELTNIHTDETSVAYSFEEAKAMVKEAKDRLRPSEDAARFWRALFSRSTKTASSASGNAKSPSDESKQTAKAARAHEAGQRSRTKSAKLPDNTPDTTESLSLDDVQAYPVLDRKTGAAV